MGMIIMLDEKFHERLTTDNFTIYTLLESLGVVSDGRTQFDYGTSQSPDHNLILELFLRRFTLSCWEISAPQTYVIGLGLVLNECGTGDHDLEEEFTISVCPNVGNEAGVGQVQSYGSFDRVQNRVLMATRTNEDLIDWLQRLTDLQYGLVWDIQKPHPRIGSHSPGNTVVSGDK